MKIWTEPEMQALRQRYPVELTAELAAELGRPAKHVRCKAFSMGLIAAACNLNLSLLT